MASLTELSSVNWEELTEPTEDEVRKYVFGTLCDIACPYGSFLCYDNNDACKIMEKYKTGELSFRKTKEGKVIRLF